MKRLTIFTAATVLTASLVACGGGGATAPTQTIKSIEVTPGTLNLQVGQAATLTAVARDADGQTVNGVTFTWKSSQETVAKVAGGTVTAQASGTAQITASASNVTSSPAGVTVTAPQAGALTLTASTDRLPVITGTSANLSVNITRPGGFTGPVTVQLSGLPAGASSAAVTIPAGQSAATVTVNAAALAAHSQPTGAVLTASAEGLANVTKAVTVTVRGPAGSLDTTFGTGGVATTAFGTGEDFGYATAIQTDGKIIVAGSVDGSGTDFAVARYTRDGALDATFGTGGKVRIDFSGKSDVARAVAVQSDGKIVVAGSTVNASNEERFGIVRLSAVGALDTGFGTGGRVVTALPGSSADQALAVLVQGSGHIVVGGSASFGATTGLDFALARYTSAGVLDSSFGSGGTVTTAIRANTGSDVVHALAEQAGKIVAVGGEGDFQAARYTASGVLDGTFGTGGKVNALFGSTIGVANAVAVDAQNRLVLAGQRDNDTAAARLNSNGTLDTTFGTGGKAVVAYSAVNWDVAEGVAVQTDGAVVLAGWRMPDGGGSATDFTVTRLTSAGALDATFGTNGTVVTAVAPGIKTDQAHAVALQPDDRIPATRIVAVGDRNDSNNDLALTRYWP